jgi:transcription-repair coupling factor (superfamily II helicase)
MLVGNVVEAYKASEKVLKISQKLQSPGTSHVQLKGLAGSSVSFVASALAGLTNISSLYVLADKEEAAYFLNDLERLLGKDKVLFFPQSYRKPYEIEHVDNANILLRAEVLNKILHSSAPIHVVSYPEALTEKVVTKSHLSKNTLEVKLKEKLSIEFIIDVLFEYGFERTDYVIEPGQFSVRGGIVDVFSFSEEQPYRLEFYGDEVDSIRTFDPSTQLSVSVFEKAIIIPNVQDKLVKESRQPFLEYLPDNSVIWIKEVQLTFDRMEKEYTNATEAYSSLESAIEHLPPEELFINADSFKKQLQEKKVIEFGKQFYFSAAETIVFETKPQPSFNKKFDLLYSNLVKSKTEGYNNFIFSDTPKQIERLEAIFHDIAPKTKLQLPAESEYIFTPQFFSIHEGFVDNELKLVCYTDHQLFERYHRFELKSAFNSKNREALTLKELKGLNPGDYITHIDHGIGRFGGLEKIEANGRMQEAIRLVYKDSDVLYIPIHALHRIAKYSGKEGAVPRIDKLGSSTWSNFKKKTISKVKEIAYDLIKLYAKRKNQTGFQFSQDSFMQNELEASFIYEDTPDQYKATVDVKKDMELSSPMDRLVCGDVGFGKTEIAIRAAFKAVNDGKQVAVLVPTTILALQHYKTFKERLKELPCTVDYINRFKSASEQKETVEKLAQGKIDILIGTHKIVGKEIKFKDLGLLIIDEEQKFGVGVKDKLKLMKANVDTLTLTATPIPRTLQFSLMGARDLSIINTPPPNRFPVQTELIVYNEELIRDAIRYELQRNGQVFFVHNRVQNITEVAGMIQRLCPDAKVSVGHGQMDGEKLEKIMLDFIEGESDVLVCTAIIESGLDISNANTIIINDAHMFGLSDLHQLRGRVGRSNKKAFCYLLTPPLSVLTPDARKRLKAVEEFSELGSGFQIAMRDLDIRGAGNLLGAEQSGFITEIGYEMYQKILDEALDELRDEMEEKEENKNNDEPKKERTYVRDCTIETDMELMIPDSYVSTVTERISLYKALDESKTEEALTAFEKELKDRFGPIPKQTIELIDTIRLRTLAVNIGFEKLVLKNNRMTGYFIANQASSYYQSEIFTRVLQFVQKNQRICKMKEGNSRLILSFENIKNIDAAKTALDRILRVEKEG